MVDAKPEAWIAEIKFRALERKVEWACRRIEEMLAGRATDPVERRKQQRPRRSCDFIMPPWPNFYQLLNRTRRTATTQRRREPYSTQHEAATPDAKFERRSRWSLTRTYGNSPDPRIRALERRKA